VNITVSSSLFIIIRLCNCVSPVSVVAVYSIVSGYAKLIFFVVSTNDFAEIGPLVAEVFSLPDPKRSDNRSCARDVVPPSVCVWRLHVVTRQRLTHDSPSGRGRLIIDRIQYYFDDTTTDTRESRSSSVAARSIVDVGMDLEFSIVTSPREPLRICVSF